MAIKSCLTGGDKAQIDNALKKNKPVSAEKQKLAEKQERMFTSLDKDFNKSIAGLGKKDKITAIQKKFAGNGVNITRQKINKMMKGEFTVSKPGAISPPVFKPPTPVAIAPKPPITPVAVPSKPIPVSEVGAFQEAKTLDEALTKWGEFGYNKDPFDGYHTRDWSKAKKLKAMNNINAQMNSMERWVQGRKLGKLGFDDGDQQWGGLAGVRKGMGANHITISTRSPFRPYGYGEKSTGVLKRRDFTSISGGNGSVVLRHEMGHVLWYDGSGQLRMEFGDRFRSVNKSIVEKKISKYANKNIQEAFAETFSIYSSPEFKAGSLNKVFGSGFEELMDNILVSGVK